LKSKTLSDRLHFYYVNNFHKVINNSHLYFALAPLRLLLRLALCFPNGFSFRDNITIVSL